MDRFLSDWLTQRGPDGELLRSGEYFALASAERQMIVDTYRGNGYNTIGVWPSFQGPPAYNLLKEPHKCVPFIDELRGAGLQVVMCFGLEGQSAMEAKYPPAKFAAAIDGFITPAIDERVVAYALFPELEEWGGDEDEQDRMGKAIRAHTRRPIYVHYHGGVIAGLDFSWTNPGGLFYQTGFEKTAAQVAKDTVRVLNALHDGQTAVIAEYADPREDSEAHAKMLGDAAWKAGIGHPKFMGCFQGVSRDGQGLPPVGPGPAVGFDLADVTFLDHDVRGWPKTSTLTAVTITRDGITLAHTQAGNWPVHGGIEGNPWIFAKVDGKWYASTYEWLKPGQEYKAVTADEIGPLTKNSPLRSWRPQDGELVGFMVSTHARDGQRTVPYRTGVVLRPWFSGGIVWRERMPGDTDPVPPILDPDPPFEEPDEMPRQPYPGDDWCKAAQEDINALYVKYGREPPLDPTSAVHIGRTLYDVGNGEAPASSLARHLVECEVELEREAAARAADGPPA